MPKKSVFSLLQKCSACIVNAKWVFKVKMVSEMKQGFTIPIEIHITFRSKCQQFAVLTTTTIIPKRPGRTKSIQLEGGGIYKKKIKKKSVLRVKMSQTTKPLKLQELNKHINFFYLFLRTSLL